LIASCPILSIPPMAVFIVFPASFAALFNELPTSWAVLPIELPISFGLMLMSRLCTCPDKISSEVGAI
jgi:hypothetical protein